MPNEISLTVRLPAELNEQLAAAAKSLGMTKTNLIRFGIHEYQSDPDAHLDFSMSRVASRYRLVLNVNALTFSILDTLCKQSGESMNAVVTALCIYAVERCARLL